MQRYTEQIEVNNYLVYGLQLLNGHSIRLKNDRLGLFKLSLLTHKSL